MTFMLLWCEKCGHAEDVRTKPRLPHQSVTSGPLVCVECQEPVTLLKDCRVAGSQRDRRGRWVAYVEDLA